MANASFSFDVVDAETLNEFHIKYGDSSYSTK